jgi:hypothetical protein
MGLDEFKTFLEGFGDSHIGSAKEVTQSDDRARMASQTGAALSREGWVQEPDGKVSLLRVDACPDSQQALWLAHGTCALALKARFPNRFLRSVFCWPKSTPQVDLCRIILI